jgi:hypothetical protein
MRRRPHRDSRYDRKALGLEESLIDAHLLTRSGLLRVVFCELPVSPRSLALPRLLAHMEGDHKIAVVPGAYVTWLLSRKAGFSRAESYLSSMVGLLREHGRDTECTVRVEVWDLVEDPPADLLDKLSIRVSTPIHVVGPADLPLVLDDIRRFARHNTEFSHSRVLELARVFETGRLDPPPPFDESGH